MKIAILKQEGSHCLAIFENGETIVVNAVLLTAPVPQSLALLDTGGVALEASMREQLEAVEYEPCMAVMVLLNGESNVTQLSFLRFDLGPVGWIANNQAKGISAVSAVTIQATPAFSLEHQKDGRQKIGQYCWKLLLLGSVLKLRRFKFMPGGMRDQGMSKTIPI